MFLKLKIQAVGSVYREMLLLFNENCCDFVK